MEASENKLVNYTIDWGDFEKVKMLIEDITYRKGHLGSMLAEGVFHTSERIGKESKKWAMHVKGLEITAYDCHTTPAMALAYGTAATGAHHKDAWIIGWEIKHGRGSYDEVKVDKIIELQRIRGGIFECLTTCRLPWAQVSFNLDWYPKFLKAATGISITLEDMYAVADRVYSLIRAFWVREFGKQWKSSMDMAPVRWFTEPLTKGALKGTRLDLTGYENMLKLYYTKRGWDRRGIPTESTLNLLGLQDVVKQLRRHIQLSP